MSGARALLFEGLERGLFPAAAMAVAEPEGILFEEYAGEAVLEPAAARREAGPRTLWDLDALTRPIAGAPLVIGLARERAFSLDDPIGRFSDAFKKTRFEGVTLRLLLRHQAGLREWFPCYVRGEGRRAFARAIADVDPAGPPGAGVLPSSLGYLMLAEALERGAAAAIDTLFLERIAAPLGVADDLLFAPAGEDRPRAAGGERDDATERRLVASRGLAYVGFRNGVVNGEVNDGNALRRAAGVSLHAGLFGTARAVAEAGRAWLVPDGRILHEADVAAVAAGAAPDSGDRPVPGWRSAAAKGSPGAPLSPSSFGETGETGSSLYVDPERARVFVLLANRLHPDARAGDLDAFRARFHELAKGL